MSVCLIEGILHMGAVFTGISVDGFATVFWVLCFLAAQLCLGSSLIY